MAKYRKLGRTSDQRKALLRSQVTALIYNGKIVTTEARAKEVRKLAERLITLAIKERDNYETVKVTAKVARKDKDGKRVKQIIDKNTKAVLSETHRDKDGKILRIDNGVTVTVYDEVEKEIKKQFFPNMPMVIKFYEHFHLSAQYNPEKLMDVYGDSILAELREYSPVEYNLFKRADMAFTEDKLQLTVEDTVLGKSKAEELKRLAQGRMGPSFPFC